MKFLFKVLSTQKDFILIVIIFSVGFFLLGYDYAGSKIIDPPKTNLTAQEVNKTKIIADIKQARSMFNFVFTDVMLHRIQQEIPHNSTLEIAIDSVPFFWDDLNKHHAPQIMSINNKHTELFNNFYKPFLVSELNDYLLVHQSPYFFSINKRFGREMLDISNNEYNYLEAEISEDMHSFIDEYLKTSLPKEQTRTKL